MITRREIAGGLLIAITAPFASAQVQTKQYRIAIITAANPVNLVTSTGNPNWRAFFAELNRRGFIEEKNLTVDRYSGEGRPEHFPEVAREAIARKPDAIVAITNIIVKAVAEQTTTIPIVSATADPLKLGLVASLARPGGNVTGISSDAGLEIIGKRLQLLKEAVPSATRVGYLVTRQLWDGPYAQALRAAGDTIGVSIIGMLLSATQDEDYKNLFVAMASERLEGIIASDQSDNFVHRKKIVSLVAENRLPAMYPYRDFVDIGGLMSYASNLNEMFRYLAGQLADVLSGQSPAEMPIYQASKFEFVVNLKAANHLGLALPSTLLVAADEVIE